VTGDELDPLRRRVYRDPPVVEAVCRVHWSAPIKWDLMTPGLLFEKLRGTYPAEPRLQPSIRADIQQPGMQAAFQLTAGTQQFAFASDDGTRMLIVNAESVSAHSLQPYEGWPSLVERLFVGLGLLEGILPTADCVALIGLRYINRIEISEPTWEFRDYVNLDLTFPDGIPPNVSGFIQRVEVPYEDEPTLLAFTWASVAATPGSSAFVLDLDFVNRPEAPLDIESSREALADLKSKEGRAFEALITDRLRGIFVENG